MSIVYRTSNLSKWGSGIGSNLSASQVDNNFYELYLAIQSINVSSGVGISNIETDNDQLTITLTDNTTFGPFTLPTAKFTARGNWVPNTSYNVNDIITSNGSVYVVSYAHISANTFNAGANSGAGNDHYSLMFATPDHQVPYGGLSGYVLTKLSSVDYVYGWTKPYYLPTGGNDGQVLTKSGVTDGVAVWQTPISIPSGGLSGYYLRKASNSDFDVEWSVNGIVPAGGLSGQTLTKSSAADYSLVWSSPNNQTSVAIPISSSVTQIDPNLADIFVFTATQSTEVTINGFSNKPLYFIITSSSTLETVTFESTSFVTQSSLSVINSNKKYTLVFIPYQNQYYEISRIGPM